MELTRWLFGNYIKRSFITSDGNLSYLFPNIFYVFKNLVHPGYIFAGLVFLMFFRKKQMEKPFIKAVSLVILFYALFLAGMQFQNDRVLLLSFPMVLILFSGSFITLAGKLSFRHFKKLAIFSVIVIQIVLFCVAFRPFYHNNVITHEIAINMIKYPGKKIYTFNMDMALKGYGIKNETISLWSNKIDFFEPNALVLFNFTDSKKQWSGMNPMLNWENLNRDHHLKLLENFPDGWNLYEITD